MDLKIKSRFATLVTVAYFVISTILVMSIIKGNTSNIGFAVIYAIIIGSGAVFYWFIEYTEKIRFIILESKKEEKKI